MPKRGARSIVLALLALAVAADVVLGAAIVLTSEPGPRPLTAERVAQASKPAVVFIESQYAITASLPQWIVTDATWSSIYDSLQARHRYYSVTQLEHDAEQVIMNNPGAYMSRGNAVSNTWDQWATGSGFFVTEDGYLVTAAHVVSATKEDARAEIVAYVNDPAFAATDANDIRKSWADFSPTDAQVQNLVAFDQSWIKQYVSVDKIDARYYLGSGASVVAGDNITATGVRASVVSIDPTAGGHDIAILKADVSGVPALPIAATNPRLNDATNAIGYPRSAYLQEAVPTNQDVPIAVTVGTVRHMNSRTAVDGGSWTVYGTDAQFTHGDSGGPVVDAQGEVIGVISFIVPDANGNQLPGQGYFIPPSYINADLAKAGVSIAPDPNRSNLTSTYYRALAKGDNGRYRQELNLLLGIQSRAPKDRYVVDEIDRVRSEIAAGNDTTPPDLRVYILPAAGASAAVVLVALASWLAPRLAKSRRRPHEPSSGTALPAD